MPNKDLTISIPEPVDGECNDTCPLYRCDEWESSCSMGLAIPSKAGTYSKLPGKNCPQYQDKKEVKP
jgi:hypothetical protein